MPRRIGPSIIPVDEAQQLAEQHDCPLLIIFALHDTRGASFTITTYGKNEVLCKLAASFGKQFAKAIFDRKVEPPQDEPMNLPDIPSLWQSQ